jgi:hypothetical protein
MLIMIEIILNCLLVQNNVRSAYLVSYESITADYIKNIQQIFPKLHLEKTLYFSHEYDLLITNHKLNVTDYDTNFKIGTLLGYPTADHFPINKTDKDKGYYTYHIKVKLSKKKTITLFSFVAKDTSKYNEILILLNNIKKSLLSNSIAEFIKDIYIEQIKQNKKNILEIVFIY